jgi:hypothetical protein
MPRSNKDETPIAVDSPMMTARYAELDGYTVGFESYHADADGAPFFRGLPGDRCQCPHWGVVVSGRLVFRYPDGEETFHAGDAYYARPGHTPEVSAGTEVVEFSPTEQLQATMAVVSANMEAALG